MSTKRGNDSLPVVLAGVSSVIARSAALVRGVAFWVAALLPFSYVPLLQSAAVTVPGFAKLVLLNVVALLVGHGYGSSDRSTEDRSRYRG